MLALYDLQGYLVKIIQSMQILPQGKHNIVIESQNLPNGMYLCTPIAGNKHLNPKVVLLR